MQVLINTVHVGLVLSGTPASSDHIYRHTPSNPSTRKPSSIAKALSLTIAGDLNVRPRYHGLESYDANGSTTSTRSSSASRFGLNAKMLSSISTTSYSSPSTSPLTTSPRTSKSVPTTPTSRPSSSSRLSTPSRQIRSHRRTCLSSRMTTRSLDLVMAMKTPLGDGFLVRWARYMKKGCAADAIALWRAPHHTVIEATALDGPKLHLS